MATKLFVRFSTAADADAIFDFYAENPHAFVAKREPEVWNERISSGAVTIIHDEQGKIVASSISYPITGTDKQGNETHMWTEIGSTRVSQEGIGLFKTLLSAQIVRAYLLEPPEDRFALEIIKGNEHSKHVFLKSGATEFDIPEEMQKKVNSTMQEGFKNLNVNWFQLGIETIPQFAKNLVDADQNPKVVNKATGEEFELDFSRCTLFTMFRDAVENVAGMDYGDTQKPNSKHGVRAFRDKFHP